MTEVIHEYFIVTPDGKVRREVRIGTERLDDFNDPANVTVQELTLSAEGIAELSLAVRAFASAAPGCDRSSGRETADGAAGGMAQVRRRAFTQPATQATETVNEHRLPRRRQQDAVEERRLRHGPGVRRLFLEGDASRRTRRRPSGTS